MDAREMRRVEFVAFEPIPKTKQFTEWRSEEKSC